MPTVADDQLDALVDALAGMFGAAHVRRGDRSVAVEISAGEAIDIAVRGLSSARPGIAGSLDSDRPMLLVADRIPAAQRAELDAADIGWFDRRGHLTFHHGSVWIDVDVPSSSRAAVGRRSPALLGPVAFGIAASALVAFPGSLPAVRELARRLGASPAGVSQAVTRLIEVGLLTRDRRAAVPALFWSFAETWTPEWAALASAPEPCDELVAVGTRAAIALGAPAASTRGEPLDLLVADSATLRCLVRASSAVTNGPPVRVALAPAPFVPDEPFAVLVDGHRTAPVAIVAASIADEGGRGAEVVDRWELADRAW